MRPIQFKRSRARQIDDMLDGMERVRQHREMAMDYDECSGPTGEMPHRPNQARINMMRVWTKWRTGTYADGT